MSLASCQIYVALLGQWPITVPSRRCICAPPEDRQRLRSIYPFRVGKWREFILKGCRGFGTRNFGGQATGASGDGRRRRIDELSPGAADWVSCPYLDCYWQCYAVCVVALKRFVDDGREPVVFFYCLRPRTVPSDRSVEASEERALAGALPLTMEGEVRLGGSHGS
ncbi:hypothetical protein EVAR_77026_1 [Eumeta japonica]|uniref:Uncharacterized protein n=1 Tax=Eumeta variegata TaxID=151549 RepID=A0A4C1T3A1_EUMVA|nr:hypothetical protein EVAR_77026_1 [Eumeta japonica]